MGICLSAWLGDTKQSEGDTERSEDTRRFEMIRNARMNNTTRPFKVDQGIHPIVVHSVKDGDTIVVDCVLHGVVYTLNVRIAGINCPEIHTRDPVEKIHGQACKKYLENLLGLLNNSDNVAHRTPDTYMQISQSEDKFGRVLASVWCITPDNRKIDIATEMLQNTTACAYEGQRKPLFTYDTSRYYSIDYTQWLDQISRTK